MKVIVIAFVLIFPSALMAESQSESETVSPLSLCKLTSSCDID